MVGGYSARRKMTHKQNTSHTLKDGGAFSQYKVNSNSILKYLCSPAICVWDLCQCTFPLETKSLWVMRLRI